ncbi:ATP-dependent helicase HrpB [Psychrobium sp. MM17-31]|uniref:ATP-dependent helicase HrpB n=1 Tax=Psychrobium sp. MM17-31 TaxID=2917758 RepID=UPI001EF4C4B1|nr:ATP-dependent helicase HrpB [Psychrobium sp. MM17-31]
MNPPPIDAVLSDINAQLTAHNQLILQAPPGAGKSTYLPLKLLTHLKFSEQKILMLEPRRLAAKNIARFVAKQLGENVGETVGYRVKGETKVSKNTRLEIITEGILTRMLQSDPELENVGLVIFDEYHERSIHADTALAFCLEIQEAYRDDLSLLVMSATLNSEQLGQLLPESPIITSEGRSFEVTTNYFPRNSKAPLPPQVSKLVEQAISDFDENILVFLPSASDINKTAALLNHLPDNVDVLPLYGQLKNDAQDKAIAPTQNGKRKVVLATNIAETSITIEGISVVIDSGLVNKAVFNRNNGVTKLSKEQISQASAIQRAGRAGRVQAGYCWRMWPQEQQARLAKYDIPEIEQSDLLSLALELAKWGVSDASQLQWLNVPPKHNLQQARDLLISLGAIDDKYQLTKHGTEIYQFGSSPRLAHMMLFAKSHNLDATAAWLAAMLDQTNALGNDLDISHQLNFLTHGKNLSKAQQLIKSNAVKFSKQLGCELFDVDSDKCGLLLAHAFPDRIAKRRNKDSDDVQLANGFGASLPDNHNLKGEYLVVADLMSFAAVGNKARVFLASELNIDALEQISPELFSEHEQLAWNDKDQRVNASAQVKLGQLVIREKPLTNVDTEQFNQALCQGLRSKGLAYLDFNKAQYQLLQRLRTAHLNEPDSWPDYSESALLESLEDWLVPFFDGAKKLASLKKINFSDALLSRLDWNEQQQLNALYPTHLKVASGSNIRLDYDDSGQVKLSVRIQELFGTMTNPTVGRNQLPVLVEMLSPAQRPIQLTKDLVGFWHGSYEAVKKDMKGRYPKHYWPDDPSVAMATTKTKKKLGI